MTLTPSEIDRLARLSRLALSADQRQRMLDKLNGFFGLVEAMQAVDTRGVLPLAHPLAAIRDITLRLHPDAVSETASEAARQTNMQNAPDEQDGLFLVPKVIE